jgi:molecular chaperone DnaK
MKEKGRNKMFHLGSDLGTTPSQMAIINDTGVIEIMPNIDGDLVTPSIVSVADKEPTVGKVARQYRFLSPDKVAEQFKKAMDAVTETGELIPLVTGADGTEFTAVMLSGELISYLKVSAEKLLGQSIPYAVISVPAYFKRQARQATKEAGLVAGFKEVHIVDEPTAGATFYGLSKGATQKIAVFDFGGGTFDISILQITTDGAIDPIAVDGDPECGGTNIDEVIFQHVRQFVSKNGGDLNPEKDLAEWLDCLDACKQAKETLAHKDSAIVPLRVGSQRLTMEVTYAELKAWSADIIHNLKSCCKRALEKAALMPSEINRVVLIGGSSRLRFVPEIVAEIFAQQPVTDTDPDMAVAKGNAILAAAYFASSDDELLIEGKRYLPSSIKPSQIAGRDLCVAAITEKSVDKTTEFNCPIIPSGAKLPYEATEYFSPVKADAKGVEVKLIDGAPYEPSANFTPLQVAEIEVQPTNASSNENRIEFKVRMDIEGMVHLSVRDTLLNKPVPIKFQFHTDLSDAQIDQQRKALEKRHCKAG